MARIRFFAAAADAVGSDEAQLQVASVGDLRQELSERYGSTTADVVAKCSIMIDGVRVESNEHVIHDGDTVDVLPPFAGG